MFKKIGQSFPPQIKRTGKKFLPLIVFLVLASASVFIWYQLNLKDQRVIYEDAKGISQQVALRLQDAIEARLKVLDLVSHRWIKRNEYTKERFQSFASLIYSAFPGFHTISWADANGVIRWIYPEESHKIALNLNLHQHPNSICRETFEQAEKTRRFTITSTFTLLDKDQGIAIFYPLILADGNLQGYLNATFKIKPLIEACLPRDIDKRLSFSVYEGDNTIYHTGETNQYLIDHKQLLINPKWNNTRAEVNFNGKTWVIQVCPYQYFQRINYSHINLIALFFGLFLALGISLITFFLIKRGDQHNSAKEIALREKQFSENIISNIPSALLVINKNFRVVTVNSSFLKLRNLPDHEVIGKSITEALGCVQRSLNSHTSNGICPVCNKLSLLFEQGISSFDVTEEIEFEGIGARWIRFSTTMIDRIGEKEALLIFDDITEQKKIQEELRQSEAQYRNTLDCIGDAIHVVDSDLKILLTNCRFTQWCEELGIDSNLVGKNVFNVFHFLSPKVQSEYEQVFATGETLVTDEKSIIDGREIITETRKIPIFERGKVMRVVTVVHDITKRRKAESEIRLLAHTISSVYEAVFITDLESRLLFLNQAACQIYRCQPEQLLNQKMSIVQAYEQKPSREEIIETAIREGSWKGELYHRRLDGEIFPVLLSISVVRNEVGANVAFCAIVQDITSQKQAENTIRESEARYRTLVETTPDAIVLADLKAKVLMANQKTVELFGCKTAEELVGKDAFEFIVPEEREYALENMKKTFKTGKVTNIEYQLLRIDGSSYPAELSASLVKDNEGRPFALIATVRDISDRKWTELTRTVLHNISIAVNTTSDLDELLQTIRNELGKIVDTTNFFIALYDRETDTLTLPYFVDQKDRFTSFPAGKTMTSYVIKQARPILADKEKVKQLEAEGEIEIFGTPSKIWLGVPLKIGKEIIGAVVVQNYSDSNAITVKDMEILEFASEQIALAIERKRAFDALIENEEKYRSIVEHSHGGIAILDDNFRILYLNNEAYHIMGFSDKELKIGLIGEDFRKFLDEESAQITIDRYLRRQRGEKVPNRYEVNIIRKDGEKRCLEIISSVFKDSSGKTKTLAQFLDIMDKKLADQALKTSEELTRGIVENAPLGILYLDIEGRVIYENPNVSKIIWGTEEPALSLLGKNILEFAQIKERNYEKHFRQLLSGLPIKGLEMEITTRTGENKILEIHGSPRRGYFGELIGAVVMFLDLTHYKIMENQLRQAQKMEAIGTLAGGIAHDFNNLLTGILGNAELALMNLEIDHPLRKNLERMQKSAERAAELTAQLLSFGRRRMEQPKPVNLNGVLDETFDLLKRTIDPRIKLNVKKDPNLWVVKADTGQIHQVLMNLTVNALDAMPEGGELSIESGNITITPQYCQSHPEAQAGDHIWINIKDTGYGIPPENLDRIFEPFFTTKTLGKGTGLGLAMVYGIVKGHKGWIEVQSELKKGTVFRIYLPRVEEVPILEEEEESTELRGGNETILLVDDEEVVRNLGLSTLKRFGYRVFLAEDGIQATEIYKKKHKSINLIILDLTMPKKSGRETLSDLLKINPKVKVIISSGFDHGGPVDELLKMGAKGFIQKPYKLAQMLNSIRSILDAGK